MKNDVVEKIKGFVSNTTKKAVKFSGDAIDYTKLKLKIADIKSKLDDKYAEIGLAVYENQDDGNIEMICEDISKLRDELEEYKIKLAEYRNQKTCNSCGALCDTDDTFCKSCGEKL